MMIDITGIGDDRRLRARITKQMTRALERLGVKPVAADVVFVDVNGPKGGLDIRCALTIRLPYRPSLRAEDTAGDAQLAFDRSFAALSRQLERYRERQQERSRRPKKYFTAKRLLQPGFEATPSRRARRRVEK
jgi:ribosome-associated translation inhibitor RaiA